jgi:hypothetical protein
LTGDPARPTLRFQLSAFSFQLSPSAFSLQPSAFSFQLSALDTELIMRSRPARAVSEMAEILA